MQGGEGGPVAAAVDKNSGKLAWQSQAKNLGGFGAAVVAEVQGKRQLVVFGGKKLYGMDPQTGRTIWNEPWETRYDVNAATPIVQATKSSSPAATAPITAAARSSSSPPTG